MVAHITLVLVAEVKCAGVKFDQLRERKHGDELLSKPDVVAGPIQFDGVQRGDCAILNSEHLAHDRRGTLFIIAF